MEVERLKGDPSVAWMSSVANLSQDFLTSIHPRIWWYERVDSGLMDKKLDGRSELGALNAMPDCRQRQHKTITLHSSS